MTTLTFSIVFGLVITAIVVMLALSVKRIPTVKAGKVDKFCLRYELSGRKQSDKIVCDDRLINVEGMDVLSVCGNSMSDYGIRNGNIVYVNTIKNEEEKMHISTHPVLVLDILKGSKIQSQYKLRKFVSYVDDVSHVDWGLVYDKVNKDFRMKISREDFISTLTNKVKKLDSDLMARYVLSETLNEQSLLHEYSLHTASSIHGTVKYVI